ncbi:S9 family peptidase [Asticcacaulis sp. AC402]|uniref:alpha/beta hydrolase family protein n=1 Tax=Asticcacaulis sp. AC402 TaxID=1282361 RepID=UPI0003C3E1E0|nr:S9 family peptidase [Asticcacaulis sp. AC402]ESQ73863.1 hypothetical protein ABAC402_17090 [Asticcacaulis sp. AC402]
MPITRRHTIASALALFLAPAVVRAADAANSLGAPPAIEVYGRFEAVAEVALSPNGNRVAMVMRKGDDRVLVDFDLTTQKTFAKPLGKAKVANILWADDERIAVVTSTTGSLDGFAGYAREFSQVVVLDLARDKSFSLFGTHQDYFPVVGGAVSVIDYKGRKMLTAIGIRRVTYTLQLLRFDPVNGNSAVITEGNRYTNGWRVDGNGHPVIRTDFREDLLKNTILIDDGSGFKEAYSDKGALDNTAVSGIGRDGKSAVIYFQTGERAHRYYNLASDGSVTGPLDKEFAGDCFALYHPATRFLSGFAYQSYGADEYDFEYFEAEDQSRYKAVKTAMGDYRSASIAQADDPNKRVVYSEGFDDPGSYFFMNLATGKAISIGQQRPDLPPEWVAEKRSIRYKAADGLEIHGYLTLPPGRSAKALPLVVLPHGGPQANDDASFDWMSQAFASRGYAVLQPNYRGSSGYGQAFVEKGYGEWGRKMQTDLSDGVRYLASQSLIDPRRVAIFGWSYGGYAALAAAAFDPEPYRCAVAGAPVSDLNLMMTMEGMDSGSQRSGPFVYWKRYIGADKAKLNEVSPALHADKVTMPVLILHGTDDTTVPIIQGRKMADALKAAGKPVEMVELLREDHWLMSEEKNRVKVLELTIAFVETHNPAN